MIHFVKFECFEISKNYDLIHHTWDWDGSDPLRKSISVNANINNSQVVTK